MRPGRAPRRGFAGPRVLTALQVACGALLFGGFAAAAPPILPFDQVEAGMRAVGYTVFHGTTVETFDVEILGKLPNVGPDQNLILGRCSGGPLGETGVLAGMSGSPVIHEGRLIGAIAYSWGFSTDAIAGITPIEEMLDIARRGGAPQGARATSGTLDLTPLRNPALAGAFLDSRLAGLMPRAGAALSPAIPLSIAGLGAQGLLRIADGFTRAGFLPIQGAGSSGTVAPSPRLVPGSAMGLKLVRGDVEMAATGTVTWIDGDGLLAFGHPLFGLGSVDLPLTGARVEALLPSLNQSSRIATPLSEVGALREDRASGVYGRLGVEPRMIPVRLSLGSSGGTDHRYAFDIADDPLLAPVLLFNALNGVLASRERPFGSATIRIADGSVIKMVDGQDVELDNLFAGPTAFDYGTGLAAYILHLLMNNGWSQPQIAGVNLILDYDEMPRTARISRVTLDRTRVRPGESITATVVLRPYRGAEQTLRRTIPIPSETPPGPITLWVAGARGVNRAEETDEPLFPHSLEQLVRLINQLRRNDRVYLVAMREDNGVMVEGARLPGLPPSAARMLKPPHSRGNLAVVGQRGVFDDAIDTDFAIEGGVRLGVVVEAP